MGMVLFIYRRRAGKVVWDFTEKSQIMFGGAAGAETPSLQDCGRRIQSAAGTPASGSPADQP